MVFDGWDNVARVLPMGVSAYVALILFLRLSGSRTLAKFSAFDLVVTVALSSTLAKILLNRDVTLVEGVAAFATLILLQFAIAKLSVRTGIVERLVRSQAHVLVVDGVLDSKALRLSASPARKFKRDPERWNRWCRVGCGRRARDGRQPQQLARLPRILPRSFAGLSFGPSI